MGQVKVKHRDPGAKQKIDQDPDTHPESLTYILGCPWKLVTIVSKLVYFTYLWDEINLHI